MRKKGNGAGHGGPARGKWAPFTHSTQPPPMHKGVGRVEAAEYRRRLKEKAEAAVRAYDLAFASDDPKVQLLAAKQLEDRIYGQARQIVETQEDTRTEDEIRDAMEARRRELAG